MKVETREKQEEIVKEPDVSLKKRGKLVNQISVQAEHQS